MKFWKTLAFLAVAVALSLTAASAQQDKKDDKKQPDRKDFKDGFGGKFGGPMGEVRKVLARYDTDKNGRLDATERKTARKELESDRGKGGFGKGGPKGGFGGNKGAPKAGEKLKPADVTGYPKAGLYDTSVLRTFFLEFENDEWEAEMAAFYHTDIEVPATLVVDGKKYANVGVRFRGMSSYFGVGQGWKHSLNVSMDFVNKNQRLYGHKTLNLLNSHDDPTFMHTVLYSEIARKSIPTPRANFARVAINGESWGIYTSVEQFDKVFLEEQFGSKKGDRWKVQGSPGGRGGLEYLGDDVAEYKRRYTLKSDESEKAWKALAELCKVLNRTPADKLEAALKPILDVDGALWFLALDCALVNMDGYWVRASDYAIYRDGKGKFHLVPHDLNETFSTGGGPGGMGGPPGKGGPFRPATMLVKPLLDAQDKDKDSKLSKAEVTAAARALFDACEADKKGQVSTEALEKALDKILPRPNFGGNFQPPSQAPMLARSITEKAGKDGKVTKDALVAGAEKRFAAADKNKDGKLDEEELAEGLNEFFPAPKFDFKGKDGGFKGKDGGFKGKGGPGGGFGGGGVQLDPLVGLTDSSKPLRSKLLAVPALKERYLKYVKIIAEERLSWKKLGPQVAAYRKLIEKDVKADTRKLYSLEAFERGTADELDSKDVRGGSLRAFAEGRSKFLLEHAEIKKLN